MFEDFVQWWTGISGFTRSVVVIATCFAPLAVSMLLTFLWAVLLPHNSWTVWSLRVMVIGIAALGIACGVWVVAAHLAAANQGHVFTRNVNNGILAVPLLGVFLSCYGVYDLWRLE